jgi:hypothetical protein
LGDSDPNASFVEELVTAGDNDEVHVPVGVFSISPQDEDDPIGVLIVKTVGLLPMIEGCTRLFHGTNIAAATGLLESGPVVRCLREDCDYGLGFYTSTNLEVAVSFATFSSSIDGALIVFDIDNRLFREHSREVRLDEKLWKVFIEQERLGLRAGWKNVVPHLREIHQNAFLIHEGRVSFESGDGSQGLHPEWTQTVFRYINADRRALDWISPWSPFVRRVSVVRLRRGFE